MADDPPASPEFPTLRPTFDYVQELETLFMPWLVIRYSASLLAPEDLVEIRAKARTLVASAISRAQREAFEAGRLAAKIQSERTP